MELILETNLNESLPPGKLIRIKTNFTKKVILFILVDGSKINRKSSDSYFF